MNDTITFNVKYEAGHSYNETWEKIDYFCPACGKQAVWHAVSAGDYYVGEQFLCADCSAEFYLPNGASPNEKSWQNKQRLEFIRL